MLSMQVAQLAAIIEGTAEGMEIVPTGPGTRALLAAARAIQWLEDLGTAQVRCGACGFWAREDYQLQAWICMRCGASGITTENGRLWIGRVR